MNNLLPPTLRLGASLRRSPLLLLLPLTQTAPLSAKAFARPRANSSRKSLPKPPQSQAQTQTPAQAQTQTPSQSQSQTTTTAPPPAKPTTITRPLTPPPAKTEAELGSLYSYVVRRTISHGLPVYRRWKSGDTREIILLKKVDGDRRKLVEDLIHGVGVDSQRIRINPTTKHIELQGNYLATVKDWLLSKGF